MNRHERPLCVAQAEPASRLETAGFSVTGFIAERLAEKGDPNAVDFGMRRLGIDIHSTEAARFRELLLQLTHDLLVRRGELVTQRQRALRDAIAARVIKAN